ncbi:MAG: Molybdopterin-guanine dinucleotide biosynthesis protein MobA [uncultured Sulfurovum sp.]|uniref:Probable molybdenum cofactor guanylyltransferase n=1 Tax=uncultured Sulfurovum sp. TaxID=269237 RepID=A0A6S6UIA6_9BACT|nr:MAG: Molybdopterin-guanine dinucleotide biosynthesis protein MobA [uncultured Sulfurovum sp.]
MKYPIPAIIFAGGKSSRMGKDKALLPFKTYPTLSEFQHHKLTALFQSVYLSSKGHKFNFACNVIEDIYKQSSPLVGIVSVFETLQSNTVFILSVDAPLVDKEVVDKLYLKKLALDKVHTPYDAIIAHSPHGLEPLCGIYTSHVLKKAKQHLEEDNHKLHALLHASNIKLVYFDDTLPFSNINTPEQYKAILD